MCKTRQFCATRRESEMAETPSVRNGPFRKSNLLVALPKFLPQDWKRGFILLVIVWALSSFPDSIAAALIGGAMVHQLFRAKVHIGYLAGIVAA
jgi:hypothetical protein